LFGSKLSKKILVKYPRQQKLKSCFKKSLIQIFHSKPENILIIPYYSSHDMTLIPGTAIFERFCSLNTGSGSGNPSFLNEKIKRRKVLRHLISSIVPGLF